MKKDRRISFALILSLLMHVALGLFLMLQKKSEPLTPKVVEVEWVELDSFDTDPTKAKQIVQQDEKSINEKKPVKDYKLSAKDQDVLQETKAQKNGEFKNRKNTKEGLSKAPSPKAAPKKFSLKDLSPKMYDANLATAKLVKPAAPAMSGAEVSQSDDYLKDVVAGAETLLKTREFVYYSYYNRIKKKLRYHWEPRIKKKIVKILRKGRRLASVQDKVTRLVITLDKGGELVRIQVRDASGYNDLDDAAIEAFRAAAPFPNPPAGIVDGSGNVQIKWDFVLET